MQTGSMPNAQRPWNKGRLLGAKPPLRTKHVWSIRTMLQVNSQVRDLATFNLHRQQTNRARGAPVGLALIRLRQARAIGVWNPPVPIQPHGFKRTSAVVYRGGYSRPMEQDEAGTFARLMAWRNELIEPQIETHHGGKMPARQVGCKR
jgi:hypothetical protein